jgi:hypothetical protein
MEFHETWYDSLWWSGRIFNSKKYFDSISFRKGNVMNSIIILFLGLQLNSFAKSICKHGSPQSLGQPQNVQLNPLPNPNEILFSNNSPLFFKPSISQKTNIKYSKRMKILLLSATNDPVLEPTILLAKNTLNNYGIPFEHVYFVENKIKINPLPKLLDEEDNPLYYGIILSNGLLAYQDALGFFLSALSKEEWITLHDFNSNFNIRLVSLYSYPQEQLGVKVVPTDFPGKTVDLLPTQSFINLDTAYPHDLKFNLSYSWSYPAKLHDSKRAKPLLFFSEHKDNEGLSTIASVQLQTDDNREEIHFFFAQSYLFTSSTSISAAWIHWLTKNMYLGKRRIYVNAHVDDLFLSTALYSKYEDPTVDSPSAEKFIYRLTPDDLELFLRQQDKEIRPLAQNAQFRLEMAFNGNGIIEHGGQFQDQLLKTAKDHIQEFTWVTHTFSHGDLDWWPYQKAKWEFLTNLIIASDFLPNNSPYFSSNGIVTPRISGLFNPQALRAMSDVGLRFAVGDNTRKDLLPQNIHHGLFTTKDLNGFEGIFIIPRYATEIYYNTSLPQELTDEYNFIYTKYFGRESTSEEIFEREKKRVIRQLLSYEYSPYMFHQANLRSFVWGNKRESLLGLWLKNIFEEIRLYSNLPILSAKMNDLAELYFQRRNLDFCDIEVWQQFENKILKSIKIENKNACKVWITMNSNQSILRWDLENYGSDKTFYQSFSPNQISGYKIK